MAANNHYTLAEVNDLLKACQSFGLEVIPLVQTFGHKEVILKHERFSYLRDVEEMPESICPCHNDTMGVVREIVDQVMAVHKKSKYLHIGCDEVFHLGECRQCNGSGRSSLFVNHVTKVAEYVNKSHNVQTIIWDDMLRNLFFDDLLPLSKLVEPMVWVMLKMCTELSHPIHGTGTAWPLTTSGLRVPSKELMERLLSYLMFKDICRTTLTGWL